MISIVSLKYSMHILTTIDFVKHVATVFDLFASKPFFHEIADGLVLVSKEDHDWTLSRVLTEALSSNVLYLKLLIFGTGTLLSRHAIAHIYYFILNYIKNLP